VADDVIFSVKDADVAIDHDVISKSLLLWFSLYRKKMDADCEIQEIDIETEDCEVRTDGSEAQADPGKTI